MKITLGERFLDDLLKRSPKERETVFAVMLALPRAFREAHQHSGVGLRRIHPSGIWEARIGLGLRIVLAYEKGHAILLRLGDHDEIRAFLRSI